MACVPHPPPQVAAIIVAAPASSDGKLRVRAPGRSAHYIDGAGNMDFSCFHHAIQVRLTLRSRYIFFVRRHALSFAYRDGDEKRPVTAEVRQFPGGVRRIDARTVAFTYRNADDCGIRGGKASCPKSAYGLFLQDSSGRVRRVDPVIQNGGGSRY
jgi:hypothetical protein